MMEYSNDVYRFKRFKGQPVEVITESGMKYCGTLVCVNAAGVDIIDCKERMIHLENRHIETIVEPRMQMQRLRGDNDCARGQGEDCCDGDCCDGDCCDSDCCDSDCCDSDCCDGDCCDDDCCDSDCFEEDRFDGLNLDAFEDDDDGVFASREYKVEHEETARDEAAEFRRTVRRVSGNRQGFRDRD